MRLYWILTIFVIATLFLSCFQPDEVQITIENPIPISRPDETISLSAQFLQKIFPQYDSHFFRIVDGETGQALITQAVDLNADNVIDEVLFQTNLKPNEKKLFLIRPERTKPPKEESNVHAAFIPEGMDDFTWENERIGYRFYGATRAQEEGTSTGIDVWCKRVPYPMSEKWYHQEGSYHIDTGEGADYYKVGRARGCGGSGIILDNKLVFSAVFNSWKIYAAGPIRVIFDLEFSGWQLANTQLTERKRVTLDAGHYLNKFEINYQQMGAPISFLHAGGITLRPESDIRMDREYGWMSTWEPLGEDKGFLGCAMLTDPNTINEFKTIENHRFFLLNSEPGIPVHYYAGAAWSEYGNIHTHGDWNEYIRQQLKRINNPCIVHITNEMNDEYRK